jgi:hypothetical protein
MPAITDPGKYASSATFLRKNLPDRIRIRYANALGHVSARHFILKEK